MALEQLKEKYTDLMEIQSTIFGKIYTVRRKYTEEVFAVKEDNRLKQSSIEPQIHAQLGKHQHIVQYIASFADKRRSFIVMEYCRFGNLKELIDENGTLPLRSVQHLFKQVVCALEHIHSKKLLYRNLEPYHVLIDDIDENGDMLVKLCDFGASRLIQNEKQGFLQTSVDFKSLGSILFFMITGTAFLNTPEVYEKIANFSETSADLIKRLLECDSSFGFNDIKTHPFYTFQFRGEESFCKDELSELYESLLINENEDGDESEGEEDKENIADFNIRHENASSILPEPALQCRVEMEQEVKSREVTPQSPRREEPSPAPQMNNITVDSAYTSAYSPGDEVPRARENVRNQQRNPSIFACFVAVFRALCGFK